MTIPSGRIVWIEEITQQPRLYKDTSVRITGFLTTVDIANNTAELTMNDCSIKIQVHQLSTFHYPVDSLLQCIGEVEYDETTHSACVHVRVVREFDAMDLTLYQQAVQQRRDYEQWMKSSVE
ncbi:telomere-capping, CST complex subunit-domain-containing protein [Spinellus fusiger]|nr:telomere-capping, CST complex subunit-domain-containing protein [Spinellus fusiger]